MLLCSFAVKKLKHLKFPKIRDLEKEQFLGLSGWALCDDRRDWVGP